jgi:hypothetical protein
MYHQIFLLNKKLHPISLRLSNPTKQPQDKTNLKLEEMNFLISLEQAIQEVKAAKIEDHLKILQIQ